MNSIRDDLSARGVLISDGAWGTFLQREGLQNGECPELWCVDRPDVVRGIAEAYFGAGSDMVETNSFGGSRVKLAHFGLADRAAELNERAAALSREAAGPDRHVLGSMGPTGKLLLMGDVTEEELGDMFREQAMALERGGADACCIETFADIDEARLAVRAARANTRLEVICTFTFERTVRGDFRTMMGVSPSDMAKAMIEAGAHIIGTNCGNGMEHMAVITQELRSAAPDTPILVHANAGIPETVNNVTVFPESPADMARRAVAVVQAGAGIVGGCCGTTPEHIRALSESLR